MRADTVSALEADLQPIPVTKMGQFNSLERDKIEDTQKDPVMDILLESLTEDVLQIPNRPVTMHACWGGSGCPRLCHHRHSSEGPFNLQMLSVV